MEILMEALAPRQFRRISLALGSLAALWALFVVVGAETRALAAIELPYFALLVALTIAAPTAWYFGSVRLRRYFEQVGHRRLAAFHVWRIPAALLFFWMGARGELPPLFWAIAGTGDLLAGCAAAWLVTRPADARRYWRFHLFGFADFVVAVGIGLTYTVLQDPRMAALAALPLALVPLFGVGLSGAGHLIAFDLLRRNGRPATPPDSTMRPA
jgi:hypothetical protein